MCHDPEKVAIACRVSIAAKMLTQTAISDEVGIPRQQLNLFLRRKINLLDSDMDKLIEVLDLHRLKPNLLIIAGELLDNLG